MIGAQLSRTDSHKLLQGDINLERWRRPKHIGEVSDFLMELLFVGCSEKCERLNKYTRLNETPQIRRSWLLCETRALLSQIRLRGFINKIMQMSFLCKLTVQGRWVQTESRGRSGHQGGILWQGVATNWHSVEQPQLEFHVPAGWASSWNHNRCFGTRPCLVG